MSIAVAAFLLVAAAPAAAQQPGNPPPGSGGGLSNQDLRQTVQRLSAGRPAPAGVTTVGERVRVAIEHHLSAGQIEQVVRNAGGAVGGTIGGTLTVALVPFRQLEVLEQRAGIDYVRPPGRVDEPVGNALGGGAAPSPRIGGGIVGEEVAKTNAPAWHANDWTGTGIKIGIIDGFDATRWNIAQAYGEVPAPAGTFCSRSGDHTCDVFAGGTDHGVAVAEIVHEMAPYAELYLAEATDEFDLQDVEDYFDTQGVSIITRSQTSVFDGAGNGTGAVANVINNAVADGITWFNSAGNNAGITGSPGTYWRGAWSDPNGNGRLNFSGTDETLDVLCVPRLVNGLRWSDWGTNRTDYNLYIYDDPAATNLVDSSTNSQSGGATPVEIPNWPGGLCTPGETDYVQVQLAAPGSGTAGDTLEFMMNGGAFERWQNPFSASGPGSDTASAGALSIGAIDPPTGAEIGTYSSQGPTNDNRTKPDISAAAGLANFTFANHDPPEPFRGTSAATPVAAAAGVLALDAGAAASPAQLKSYLLNSAFVERGAPGTDNVYGKGELILPPAPPNVPTTPGIPTAVAGNSAVWLHWTEALPRGSAITNYVVTPYIGAAAQPSTTVGNVGEATLTGLSNGTTYTFKVAARNAVGTGSQSEASNEVTPGSTAYPRPLAASPMQLSLVPAFKQCAYRVDQSQHAAPLALPSCVPPELVSDQLTVGTSDANGAPPKFVASLKLSVIVGDPATTADESDNKLKFSATDIRRKNLTDYTGQLRIEAMMRITDKQNQPSYTNGGTLTDQPFAAVVACSATADTTVGSTCQLNTTLDSLAPGMVKEGARTVTRFDDVRVFDGGADGIGSTTADNTVFAWQGIFTP